MLVRTEANRTREGKRNSLVKGVGCLNNMRTNQGHDLECILGIPVDKTASPKIQLEIPKPNVAVFGDEA